MIGHAYNDRLPTPEKYQSELVHCKFMRLNVQKVDSVIKELRSAEIPVPTTRCRRFVDFCISICASVKSKIKKQTEPEMIIRNFKILGIILLCGLYCSVLLFMAVTIVYTGIWPGIVMLGVAALAGCAVGVAWSYILCEEILMSSRCDNVNKSGQPIVLINIREYIEHLNMLSKGAEADIQILFQLIQELHDLPFLPGVNDYDNAREVLKHYLEEHPQCISLIRKHAVMLDAEKCTKMLEEISNSGHLSAPFTPKEEEPSKALNSVCLAGEESSEGLSDDPSSLPSTKLHLSLAFVEELSELLPVWIENSDGNHTAQSLKTTVAQGLLKELPSIRSGILKSFYSKYELNKLENNKITAIHYRKTKAGKVWGKVIEHDFHILLDELDYVHRLFNILNSCCQDNPDIIITSDQRKTLRWCSKIYMKLRKQLFDVNTQNPQTDSPSISQPPSISEDEDSGNGDLPVKNKESLDICESKSPIDPIDKEVSAHRVWSMRAIARKLNRSGLSRFKNREIINPVETDLECSISFKTFDEIAPTADQADRIVYSLTDMHLYDKSSIESLRKSKQKSHLKSPNNREYMHDLDQFPLNTLISMEQLTIESLLPETLPEDFLEKKVRRLHPAPPTDGLIADAGE